MWVWKASTTNMLNMGLFYRVMTILLALGIIIILNYCLEPCQALALTDLLNKEPSSTFHEEKND